MNYKLNFAVMLLVFSVVTYNVCMAYQNMGNLNVTGKFQQIGLLTAPSHFPVPAHKPSYSGNELAANY